MNMTIFLNRLDELQKTFKRFAKKASAIGLETSLTVGESYVKEIAVYKYDEIAHATVRDGSMFVAVQTFVIEFRDNKNHIFIWKTQKSIPLNNDGLFIGKISGTIKEHSTFNGVKQTMLTRCKAEQVID